MNKNTYWTGHILSGSDDLFNRFQRDVGAIFPRPASRSMQKSTAAEAAAAAPTPSAMAPAKTAARALSSAVPKSSAATTSAQGDEMKAGAIWYCAVQVTAVHFKIDANDPATSLSKPLDWNNAAGQQAAVMALNINQEAPAIAAHDAANYDLQWTAIAANDLTGCATVGAVVLLVQSHYE
jgi:hypothetical protein